MRFRDREPAGRGFPEAAGGLARPFGATLVCGAHPSRRRGRDTRVASNGGPGPEGRDHIQPAGPLHRCYRASARLDSLHPQRARLPRDSRARRQSLVNIGSAGRRPRLCERAEGLASDRSDRRPRPEAHTWTFQPLDVVAFAGFLALVVGVSLYASRGKHDAADYFLAGRNLPWWLIGFSLIASNISTEHFVGMGGPGVRSGARHRQLRVDGGGHARAGGPVLPAALPAGGHLHHPGIPGVPLRRAHPHAHGGLHHDRLRAGRAGHRALLGRAGPRVHLRAGRAGGHLADRHSGRRLHHLRRAQGGSVV